ncbi:MAG: hypothetical protein WAU45_14785 [Blastocatellia bacterium]
MENTKNFSSESSKTTSTTGATPASKTKPASGDLLNTAASATQRAREGVQSAYEETKHVVDEAKQVVNDAYGKTTEALSNTYDQAMVYGKENPGKLTLIAFGAGIGIGVLLAAGFTGGRSRSSRIGEPIVAALSQVAMEFLRR